MISPEQIRSTYPIIRPHIRRTPIIDLDGADFGITAARLVFKLESLQLWRSPPARRHWRRLPPAATHPRRTSASPCSSAAATVRP
jgi:hypothetical protein